MLFATVILTICLLSIQISTLIMVITLVNVKAPVVATTNWWWLISALVVA